MSKKPLLPGKDVKTQTGIGVKQVCGPSQNIERLNCYGGREVENREGCEGALSFLGERSGEKSLLNTAFSPLFLKGLARKTLNQPAELFLTVN